MKRDPFRVVLAVLLFASAALFVAGSIAEHHQSATVAQSRPKPSVEATPSGEGSQTETSPSARPRASTSVSPAGESASKEGSSSHEAAEHAVKSSTPMPSKRATVSEPTVTSTTAEGSASREAAEHAGSSPSSERIFGLDLERPGIVAIGAGMMLALGVIVLAWSRRWVLWGIGVFALAFTAFDIREAMHQNSEGRTSVLAIAAVLAAAHLAAALVALIASTRTRGKPMSVTAV